MDTVPIPLPIMPSSPDPSAPDPHALGGCDLGSTPPEVRSEMEEAFMEAGKTENLSEVLHLLGQSPDLAHCRDAFGLTLFMRVVADGRLDWIEPLLPTVDWLARDRFGNGVLTHVARGDGDSVELVMGALRAQPQVLRELLKANERGRTPLIQAAARGHAVAVRAFLPWSDPALRDEYGFDALSWAAHTGNAKCVKVLIPVSDLWGQSLQGQTPLDLATDTVGKLAKGNTKGLPSAVRWGDLCDTVDALACAMGAESVKKTLATPELSWMPNPAFLFPQMHAVMERQALEQTVRAPATSSASPGPTSLGETSLGEASASEAHSQSTETPRTPRRRV